MLVSSRHQHKAQRVAQSTAGPWRHDTRRGRHATHLAGPALACACAVNATACRCVTRALVQRAGTLQPLPLPPHCLKSDFWVLHGAFVGAAGLGQVTAGHETHAQSAISTTTCCSTVSGCAKTSCAARAGASNSSALLCSAGHRQRLRARVVIMGSLRSWLRDARCRQQAGRGAC